MTTNQSVRPTRLNDTEEDHEAWDVIPPFMSFQPPETPPSHNNGTHHDDDGVVVNEDLIWKETELQYQRTLQHMGTCMILTNDVLLSSSSTSPPIATTTDSHPLLVPRSSSSSPPTLPPRTTPSISTNPIFMTLSTTGSTNDDDDDEVVVSGSYIIVGCHDGTICAWNLHHLPAIRHYYCQKDDTTALLTPPPTIPSIDNPIHVLDTSSPLTPCCRLDTASHPYPTTSSRTMDPNDTMTTNSYLSTIVHLCRISHNTFVAMNVTGMIYIIQIITVSTTTTSEPMNIQQVWNTGRIGPTSCCCGGGTLPADRIYIGYESGHMECWSVSSSSDDSVAPTDYDTTAPILESSPLPVLLWRGNFTMNHSSPPPSIADIVVLHPPIMHTNSASDECLVVSFHNDGHPRPTTSAMVEVIDVTLVMNAWNEPQAVTSAPMKEDHTSRSLALEDFIVLPEAGREIMNILPSNRQHTYPKPFNHWIQSRGTNCLLSTTISNDTNIVAVGHADGMMTLLDTSPTTEGQTPVWGVSTSHSRYCSVYPCIGVGRIDLSDTNGNDTLTNTQQPYLVSCLRGAATYLIPLQSSHHHQDDVPVLALTVPHDMDEDVSIRYTQGFTAGNIPVKNRCHEKSSHGGDDSLPLLVYVWPGGVMDVYRCGLLPHIFPSTEDELLKELFTNGSVDALRDLIVSSCDDNDAMMNPNWTNALQEIHQHGTTTPISYNDIISNTFNSLRTEVLRWTQLENVRITT